MLLSSHKPAFLSPLGHCEPNVLSSFFLDNNIQHKHAVQKEALHEYYEKHGGAPDHH
jgi:hypothetical protein